MVFILQLGFLWMARCYDSHLAQGPFTTHSISKTLRMALFWHFLDFVWIFIFTVVYGMGHLLG